MAASREAAKAALVMQAAGRRWREGGGGDGGGDGGGEGGGEGGGDGGGGDGGGGCRQTAAKAVEKAVARAAAKAVEKAVATATATAVVMAVARRWRRWGWRRRRRGDGDGGAVAGGTRLGSPMRDNRRPEGHRPGSGSNDPDPPKKQGHLDHSPWLLAEGRVLPLPVLAARPLICQRAALAPQASVCDRVCRHGCPLGAQQLQVQHRLDAISSSSALVRSWPPSWAALQFLLRTIAHGSCTNASAASRRPIVVRLVAHGYSRAASMFDKPGLGSMRPRW